MTGPSSPAALALETLSRRAQAATGELGHALRERLQAALAAHGEHCAQAREAAGRELERLCARQPQQAAELRRLFAAGDYPAMRRLGAQAPLDAGRAALADLNRRLRELESERGDDGLDGLGSLGSLSGLGDGLARPTEGDAAPRELRSLRRFRQAWSVISTEDRLARALGRGPGNAGPLNSHMLVLRALSTMHGLSPGYLRRFLRHLDTLLWLEAEQRAQAPAKAKPARKGRQRK